MSRINDFHTGLFKYGSQRLISPSTAIFGLIIRGFHVVLCYSTLVKCPEIYWAYYSGLINRRGSKEGMEKAFIHSLSKLELSKLGSSPSSLDSEFFPS